MTNLRRNLFLLGLAGLYLGVFLGGMALPATRAWPLGFAAMMLYTALMRPPEQWRTGLRLLVTLPVIGALVALIVYAGAGLAHVLGWAPPPALGPGLALAGVALSRAVWSAARERDLAAFLTEARQHLEAEAERFEGADARQERQG